MSNEDNRSSFKGTKLHYLPAFKTIIFYKYLKTGKTRMKTSQIILSQLQNCFSFMKNTSEAEYETE